MLYGWRKVQNRGSPSFSYPDLRGKHPSIIVWIEEVAERIGPTLPRSARRASFHDNDQIMYQCTEISWRLSHGSRMAAIASEENLEFNQNIGSTEV